MITKQLRELEDDGLVVHTVYPVVLPKTEYTLTDFGKSVLPLIIQMTRWGTVYMSH